MYIEKVEVNLLNMKQYYFKELVFAGKKPLCRKKSQPEEDITAEEADILEQSKKKEKKRNGKSNFEPTTTSSIITFNMFFMILF